MRSRKYSRGLLSRSRRSQLLSLQVEVANKSRSDASTRTSVLQVRFVHVFQALGLQNTELLAKVLEVLAELGIAQAVQKVLRDLLVLVREDPLLGDLRAREEERELCARVSRA